MPRLKSMEQNAVFILVIESHHQEGRILTDLNVRDKDDQFAA